MAEIVQPAPVAVNPVKLYVYDVAPAAKVCEPPQLLVMVNVPVVGGEVMDSVPVTE